MENQGWIKIHRKLLETSFAKKPTIGWLFICLLLKANHKENKFLFNKQEIIIKPGQFLTGRKELATSAGLTEMQTRYALTCLKVTNTITIKTTNKFSVITILKYNQYQNINQQSNQPVTNKQPTSNQPVTTNNNVKNDKNVIPTSKNSLTSCTDEELKEISLLLDVSLEAVKRTHEIIKNKIASKEFKNKTVYWSLRNWIIMGIERGTIKKNPISNYKLMKTV
ncbi:MAG: hypothetical protein WCY09_10415 [Candidatus Omnitrophota bacterium]|jgi:hypothetical protein